MLNNIAAGISGRRIVPKFPIGRIAILPAELEVAPMQRARDSRSGLSYFIAYDGGSISQRRVTVKKLHLAGNVVEAMLAFCHERNALRLFRADRIDDDRPYSGRC